MPQPSLATAAALRPSACVPRQLVLSNALDATPPWGWPVIGSPAMKPSWLMLLALALALPASAGDMYSWTDANGVRHFSDSPPPASVKNAKRVAVHGGVTTPAPQAADAAQKPSSSGGPAMAAAAGYSPEDIKRNCEIAKGNLASLQANAPAKDDKGAPIDAAAAAEHQAQLDKANQQIRLFCD